MIIQTRPLPELPHGQVMPDAAWSPHQTGHEGYRSCTTTSGAYEGHRHQHNAVTPGTPSSRPSVRGLGPHLVVLAHRATYRGKGTTGVHYH